MTGGRKIPASASADVQAAFTDLYNQIDQLRGANSKTIDAKGKQITNAGQGTAQNQYVTLAQLQALVTQTLGKDVTFDSVTVNNFIRDLGTLFLLRKTDGSNHHVILWVDKNGEVTGVNDGGNCFAYNDVAAHLELGFDVVIKWLAALSEIASPGNGIVTIAADGGGSLVRLVLGGDGGGSVALVPNGTTLEIHVGGGGGLTGLKVAAFEATGNIVGDANVDAQTYSAAGTPGVDFGPGPITSITITKGIVTAAS